MPPANRKPEANRTNTVQLLSGATTIGVMTNAYLIRLYLLRVWYGIKKESALCTRIEKYSITHFCSFAE